MRLLIFLLLIPCVLSGQLLERPLPTKTIAIIHDQPSPYFDAMIEGFLAELKTQAQDQYHLKTVHLKPASPTSAQIKLLLHQAFENPNIDAVFTAGITASHAAMHLPVQQRSKPVIAGSIEFSNLTTSLITNDGGSKIPNYSFVLVSNRIPNDLKELSSLAQTKTIDVLINKEVIDTLREEISQDIAAFEKTHDIEIRITPLSPKDLSLSGLPSNAKAVYLPLLPSLTTKQRHALFKTLTRKKIIHLSMLGPDDVDAGAFASLSPRVSDTLHRRLALNLHQALLGVNTAHLPVTLRLADQLKINLATARKIGWSPDYDTTLTATFFKQEEVTKSSGTLSLESAMASAAKQSPDIQAAKASWQSSLADAQKARATYSTTANLNGSLGNQINTDRRNKFTVPANAQSAALGVEVNRLLYSNQVFRQIEALDEISTSTKLNTQSIALDTVESTGHAYLDCLLAEAIYKILRKNVQLVQENLSLANIRLAVGARDNTDSLRWQASLASARSQLMQADSNRRNARTQLNVLLATDPQQHWKLTDIPLGDHDTYFLDNALGDLVKNQAEFQNFIRFARALSTANSPELKAFDHTLRAQGILLTERSVRHKRPQVQLTAAVERIFQDSTLTRGDAQNEWTVGVGFTLPFLEKDLRRADLSKIQANISQLEAQRKGANYLIEQRALASCYNMGASHPSMRLSRTALAAAEKNYEGVRKQYSVGQANVVTLIDAQSNWLAQQQANASASYSYLKDVISLQRSIAWFEYNKTKPQVTDFLKHYRDFQKTGSTHVRLIHKTNK